MKQYLSWPYWLLMCALPLPSLAQTSAPSSIPNFRQVTPAIYRGGNFFDQGKGAESIAYLSSLHLALDIDLQGGDWDDTVAGYFCRLTEPGESTQEIQGEAAAVEQAGIGFQNLPLDSHATVTTAEGAEIDQALVLLTAATPDAPVYIHCEHGEDRTGLVVALYRVLVQGWTVKVAHDEWVADGHTTTSQLLTGDLDVYFSQRTKGLP